MAVTPTVVFAASGETTTGVVAGAVVAIVLGLFKLLEKVWPKKPHAGFTEEDRKRAVRTEVSARDAAAAGKSLMVDHAPGPDGVQRWKWPHEMNDLMRSQVMSQERLASGFESISRVLEKHIDDENDEIGEIKAMLTEIKRELRSKS